MGVLSISIDEYIALHLKNNPSEKEAELRRNINTALEAFNEGESCECGNEIWVIGTAKVGNSCFTCITGESEETDHYEIDTVLIEKENRLDPWYGDNFEIFKSGKYFDDNGNEINMDLIKKPALCLICIYNKDKDEEILCNLNRADQRNDKEFKCFQFCKK